MMDGSMGLIEMDCFKNVIFGAGIVRIIILIWGQKRQTSYNS